MQQVEQTAVWYSSWFEKVNSTGAWISSSKACETDIKLLQALLTSFLSLCIVLYCSGLENTQCGALWATVALFFQYFWQFKENIGKALSDSGRPAQVFESRPWAKLNVLQNSGSWMFMLRVSWFRSFVLQCCTGFNLQHADLFLCLIFAQRPINERKIQWSNELLLWSVTIFCW